MNLSPGNFRSLCLRFALTESGACLAILLAAGDCDAEAVFARLSPELQAAVSRNVVGAEASQCRILESCCNTGSPDEYAADLRRREEIMRRGMVAMQRVIAG